MLQPNWSLDIATFKSEPLDWSVIPLDQFHGPNLLPRVLHQQIMRNDTVEQVSISHINLNLYCYNILNQLETSSNGLYTF